MTKDKKETECYPFRNIIAVAGRPDGSDFEPCPAMYWSAAESPLLAEPDDEPDDEPDENYAAAVAEEAAAVAEVCRIAIAGGLLSSSCLLLEAAIRAGREDVDR